jgi:hypothetical protein
MGNTVQKAFFGSQSQYIGLFVDRGPDGVDKIFFVYTGLSVSLFVIITV